MRSNALTSATKGTSLPDPKIQTETLPGIETNLYATTTPEGELVWTGISDSFNPSSAKKTINNVVKVVVKDLEKEGIF